MLASSAVCPGISSTGNLVCYRLRTASVVDGEPDHYRRYSMTTSAVGLRNGSLLVEMRSGFVLWIYLKIFCVFDRVASL